MKIALALLGKAIRLLSEGLGVMVSVLGLNWWSKENDENTTVRSNLPSKEK